jgi:hypothetical protein
VEWIEDPYEKGLAKPRELGSDWHGIRNAIWVPHLRELPILLYLSQA